MKVIAVIPARAGSKGIPKKNLVEIGGKPLISWSIEEAIKSSMINTIVVTSDGDDILQVANQYKEVTTIKRPAHLAEDNTHTTPVILHALAELGIQGDSFDYLLLLQPTSPLRRAEHINEALKKIHDSEATSLISVSLPDHHPYKSFVKNEEGYLEGILNNQFPFMPRQSLPEVYQPNGAIYIIEVASFLKNQDFFTSKTVEYIMTPESSIDIDSMEDVKKAEKLC